MAPSFLTKLCACGLVLAYGLAGGAQESDNDKQELVFESGPLVFDGEANVFRMEAPKIRQGDLYLEADNAVATSVEFDAASEWRLTGNVRIEAGDAVMDADSAVFTFDQRRLTRGELSGRPASFTHFNPERQKPFSGTADVLSYDSVADTLRLTGNVLLQRDQSEVQGCDILYNLETDGFTSGDSDCGIKVRVVPDSNRQDDRTPPQ
jgi:lipopolysaccharide transport protein LptA